MSLSSPANTQGFFLEINKDFPKGWDDFLEKFLDTYRDIANGVNNREVSVYDKSELPAGQRYFQTTPSELSSNVYRQTFRQTYEFTNLPAAGVTLTIPLNITLTSASPLTFTHLYGAANDTVGLLYYPIPNFDCDLRVNAGVAPPVIEITPQSGRYLGLDGTIVLEYLKS